MPHLPSLPDNASLIEVYKAHPAVAAAALALNDAVMRQPAPFSAAEREAIAAFVSTINACQYCTGLHSGAASKLGMNDVSVEAICKRPEAPDDPRLVPVLAYVAKLTTEPASVTKDDVARILDAGWDEAAVSFAAFIAGLYAFMNRIVDGHGIRADAAAVEAGGTRLAEVGYAGIAEILAGQPSKTPSERSED
ncbi:MAG: carboxymuconolactone decarboxylase family protein [Filomicrobium sp.]